MKFIWLFVEKIDGEIDILEILFGDIFIKYEISLICRSSMRSKHGYQNSARRNEPYTP